MTEIADAGAKVATSIVDSMKSQPILLLVLLLNIAFCTLAYFAVNDQREKTQAQFMAVLTRCYPEPNRPH